MEVYENDSLEVGSYLVDRVEIPGVGSHIGVERVFADCGVEVAAGGRGRVAIGEAEFVFRVA